MFGVVPKPLWEKVAPPDSRNRIRMAMRAWLVRGGVALSGLYDLEPIRLCYLQETLQLTPAEVTACSPARHLPAAAAPLALAYGAEESAEFARHSTVYGRALSERGIACTVRALTGHNHMSICTALADARSEPLRLVLGQMGLG